MDEKSGIGKNNQLPWHLPSDLKRFKQLTMGHFIVMGRRTFATIGRTLPGRKMVVITHQKDYAASGCIVVHSLADALQVAEADHESEVFIIGGGEIFSQAIDQADKIYLTKVHTDAHADVKFPDLDFTQWNNLAEGLQSSTERDDYPSEFMILFRKR